MQRRQFLAASFAAALAASLKAVPAIAAGRRPRILLRNGWQSQNIGDIAHYMGFLELQQRYNLDAEIHFWASNLQNGADELLARTFPHVKVLKSKGEIDAAFKTCDFFLHGSSSGFGAWRDAARWHQETGKPFGVMGISITDENPQLIQTLSKAAFVYFRESVSRDRAKALGCTAPLMEFGPDTAFGVVKLRNDAAALAFMKENDLEEGKFLCCIPRYRWTPFWTLHKDRAKDEVKHARSQEMKDHDHKPHRDAIAAVVRETGMKVLVTCEDQTQIQLGKEMLYDPLPQDVKKHVVWRNRYWLTDEALSTYVRSAGLFGNEMHSPIMCIASGVPAVVCRFDEQTNKGFMWRDIGLNDWLFTLDNPADVSRIVPTVLSIAKDPAAAKAKAEAAAVTVRRIQDGQFKTLQTALAAAVK